MHLLVGFFRAEERRDEREFESLAAEARVASLEAAVAAEQLRSSVASAAAVARGLKRSLSSHESSRVAMRSH